MSKTILRNGCLGLLALVWFAVPASADPAPVNLTLTGAGSDVAYGVYISPYTATIDGPSEFQIICDDFVAHSYIGQNWNASVHSISNLAGTKWGTGKETEYREAAWLTLKILSSTSTAERGELSYALWYLFSPDAVAAHLNSYSASAYLNNRVQHWLDEAADHYEESSAQWAGFDIYTPVGTDTQEFLRYQERVSIEMRVPEPPAPALLMVCFSSVLALLVFLRRSTA